MSTTLVGVETWQLLRYLCILKNTLKNVQSASNMSSERPALPNTSNLFWISGLKENRETNLSFSAIMVWSFVVTKAKEMLEKNDWLKSIANFREKRT